MSDYDSIIIGAGHNGLVCAAYLARAGQKVLLLESAEAPGGLAANREFHPGFKTSVAHVVNHFSDRIASDLKLARYGFEGSSNVTLVTGLGREGRHVTVDGHSVTGVEQGDAEAYRRFAAQMRRFADALKPFWLKTIPRAAPGKFSKRDFQIDLLEARVREQAEDRAETPSAGQGRYARIHARGRAACARSGRREL